MEKEDIENNEGYKMANFECWCLNNGISKSQASVISQWVQKYLDRDTEELQID